MMVEKTQGSADGERMQPKGDLGEFNSHEILVDAVDAAFKDHPADDMAVVELFGVDRPSAIFGVAKNRVADRLDAIGERRNVVAP